MEPTAATPENEPHAPKARPDPSSMDLALAIAAGQGDAELVARLLAQGADPRAEPGGRTALIAAAQSGSDACVALLLPLSDPEDTDRHGATALIRAAWSGHLDCIELLLPVSRLRDGPSGLSLSMEAFLRGHRKVAELIERDGLRRGCHAEALHIDADTPLAVRSDRRQPL